MENIFSLIEVKVLPGTMKDGYYSRWRVGVPEVSNCEETRTSHAEMEFEVRKAIAYKKHNFLTQTFGD